MKCQGQCFCVAKNRHDCFLLLSVMVSRNESVKYVHVISRPQTSVFGHYAKHHFLEEIIFKTKINANYRKNKHI